MDKRLWKKKGKTFWFHLNCSLASTVLFEGGCDEREEMLHLSLNLNNFSENLAVLNLGGSFVRTIEFEQQCEVYYVVSYEILWPLRSVATMLITQT